MEVKNKIRLIVSIFVILMLILTILNHKYDWIVMNKKYNNEISEGLEEEKNIEVVTEENLIIKDGEYFCSGIEYAYQGYGAYIFENGIMVKRIGSINLELFPHDDSDAIPYKIQGNKIFFQDVEMEEIHKEIYSEDLIDYYFTYYEAEDKMVSSFNDEVLCQKEKVNYTTYFWKTSTSIQGNDFNTDNFSEDWLNEYVEDNTYIIDRARFGDEDSRYDLLNEELDNAYQKYLNLIDYDKEYVASLGFEVFNNQKFISIFGEGCYIWVGPESCCNKVDFYTYNINSITGEIVSNEKLLLDFNITEQELRIEITIELEKAIDDWQLDSLGATEIFELNLKDDIDDIALYTNEENELMISIVLENPNFGGYETYSFNLTKK